MKAEFHNKPIDLILNVLKFNFNPELTINEGQYILSKHKKKITENLVRK
jgi:hypothetical protein